MNDDVSIFFRAPRAAHAKFKARCLRERVYQKATLIKLMTLFATGRLAKFEREIADAARVPPGGSGSGWKSE